MNHIGWMRQVGTEVWRGGEDWFLFVEPAISSQLTLSIDVSSMGRLKQKVENLKPLSAEVRAQLANIVELFCSKEFAMPVVGEDWHPFTSAGSSSN